MKTISFLLLLGAAMVLARADDLTTTDGKTYQEYTVVSHDDDGISIWYKGGQATIPFDDLPPDLQKQYDYKPKEIEWETDYKASIQAAKQQNKLLLLDFTGSDWCGYCMALDKEVFPTPEFRAFARSHFICVTVDFPRQKQLPAEVARQNNELQGKYKVGGYPCLIVTDTSGKELGRFTGYDPGSGPEHIISHLKPFLAGAGAAAAN